jgi:hexosaminidase
VAISGVISGANGINLSGPGIFILSGANTYGVSGSSSGSTALASGTLVLANTNGSATGVSGVTVASGALLTGNGIATGTVDNSGIMSATNLAGGTATLTTGPQTWEAGSIYQWAINNAAGTAGATSGWDQLTVNGGVTINATSANPLAINVVSLTSANQPGALAAFDNTRDYSWRIIHSTNPPIAGFSTAALTVNSALFSNPPGSAVFSISTNNSGSGDDLFLNFVHAPALTLSNLTVAQGSNAVFGAVNTVAGSTPATAVYSWKSNNVPVSDGGRISGSATPTLTISNVQSGDAATYTVTATNRAGSNSISATLTVVITSTAVNWTTPGPIIYGAALTTNQLDATANLPGSFVYNPAAGTLLNAGTNVLSVVFTPTDTNDYQSVTNDVSLVVSTAPLTVTAASFTRPLGAANPTFTGTIVGLQNGDNITATYACSATSNSPAGAYPILPTLVDPNNRLPNYAISLVSGTLAVGTFVTWANPAAIAYGTALGSNQLDAIADVPGTFAYTPVVGTRFHVGTYPLAVVFTPNDTLDYQTVTDSVSLTVSPASLTVAAANVTRQAGIANPVFTGTITGLQNSDNITATYSTVATSASPPGAYPIVPALVDPNDLETNYSVSLVNGTLAITPPAPPITAAIPNLIPLPVTLQTQPGTFTLCPSQSSPPVPAHAVMQILVDGASLQTGQYLAAALFKSTGYQFQLAANPATNAVKGAILITTSNAISTLGSEGYELTVAPDSVVIRAPAQGGTFYGVQSLLQLLPPQIYSPRIVTNVAWVAPCVYIEDYPLYSWRGVMLDVARHFFNRDEVKQLLDAMAMHKLNTLHLHLSDDQGWRLQIIGNPELTPTPTSGVAAGAWRNGIDYGLSPRASTAFDPASGQYGGYYTQSDAREMVAYAAARHIAVVPEIEIPLHTSAVLAADPQFSCGHSASTYPLDYPSPGINYNADVFSPGTAATMTFFTNALTQIMNLFPGQYVHCGGDELISLSTSLAFTSPENDNDWNTYPADTNNMIANGITPDTYVNNNLLPEFTTCAELSGNSPVYPTANSCCGDISIVQYQHWLSSTLANFIHANGRTMMGWTEYEFGGLVPNAGIMDWEPIGSGVYAAQAAKAGLPAVVAPGTYCYFNYVEGATSSSLPVEPPFVVGGTPSYLPLSTVYSFNPMPCGLAAPAANNLLGAQAILFTEYVPSMRNVMFKLFPRSTAMAEVLWTPAASQNYTSFTNRLATHEQRFAQMGLNYDHESIPTVGGWTNVTTSGSTLTYNITTNVTAAGEIDISFWYLSGSPLAITSVALLVNGVQVDIDTHSGLAESSSTYQSTAPFIPVYTLYIVHLPELVPGATYTIKAVVAGSGGTATSGAVYMPNWD